MGVPREYIISSDTISIAALLRHGGWPSILFASVCCYRFRITARLANMFISTRPSHSSNRGVCATHLNMTTSSYAPWERG
jgi:hypothetical protein